MDRNLLKDWKIKANAILKEIKSDNITRTNRIMINVINRLMDK